MPQQRLSGMACRSAIGIVACSGAEAGLDLWAKILAANRARLGPAFRGDIDAPAVEIVSEPKLDLSVDLQRHGAGVRRRLLEVCRAMALQVDHYAIACNTLHCFAEEGCALPGRGRLVGLPDAAADHLTRQGATRVALLGAPSVMDLNGGSSPYSELRSRFEIETPSDPAEVERLILAVKRCGPGAAGLAQSLARILAGLEAPVVLLACTELPLLPPPREGPELIDPTRLVAERLVDLRQSAASDEMLA